MFKLVFQYSLMGLLFSSASLGFAEGFEDDLKKALDRANQQDSKGAIQDLEKLAVKAPGDARVNLSLGLLYQSNDQIDLAIEQLQKAVGLSPSIQGYYALGLLYEAKLVSTKDEFWKGKALEAWSGFLRLAPKDHPQRGVGEKHLKNLKELQDVK